MSQTYRYRWALACALACLLLSCQSEGLPLRDADELPEVYDVPLTLDLSAAVAEDKTRALDFVVYDESKDGVTSANPHLELEQFQDPAGMEVNLIFVRTDAAGASAPVSVIQTRLKPETAYHHPAPPISPIPERSPRRERYLRTAPGTGNQITLRAGTNLHVGTWKVAMYVGDLSNRNYVSSVDPNSLEQVKPPSAAHLQSDELIRSRYEAGYSNLQGISKSSPGKSPLSPQEKTSLSVPYLSEWITITPSMLSGTGAGTKLDLGRIPLRPQGTLLRIQVRNQDFSTIKLAGMRLLTNSLSFRGAYNFGDASLRASAQDPAGDLSTLYEERNVFGAPYQDSVERTLAYPNYADFWVDKTQAEELRPGEDSKYYLIWAMPRRDASDRTKSRQGILHVLLYDAHRSDDSYNRSFTYRGRGDTWVLPRGLIRKPALTRTFDRGYFRLSSARQAGQYFRLHAVQTKVHNFLDFMVAPTDQKYYSLEEMQRYTAPPQTRVANKGDWAGIFPVKLPDNPLVYEGRRLDHYYVGTESNVTGKFFNSNRYGLVINSEYTGSGDGQVALVLSQDDAGYFTPQAGAGYDISRAGKSNNLQIVHLPQAMLVPSMRHGVLQESSAQDVPLLFSTYQSRTSTNRFALIGWGAGQTYLSATVYRQRGSIIEVTSRYLGPAFHRPYNGLWSQAYPWDVSFYPFGIMDTEDPRSPTTTEVEDTHRDIPALGYLLDDRTAPESAASPYRAANSLVYWSSDTNWVYLYLSSWDNSAPGYSGRTEPPSGFGKPGNADRSEIYSTDWHRQPKAPILRFSDVAQPRR